MRSARHQLGREPSQAVQRLFENRLREAREEEKRRREYEDFSVDSGAVTGRIHRVSGGPASPIPEEEEGRERRKSKEIFVTQSEQASRDDDDDVAINNH